jgi:hypothetical protein
LGNGGDEKFSDKPEETAELAEDIDYTYRLLESVDDEILQSEKTGLIV